MLQKHLKQLSRQYYKFFGNLDVVSIVENRQISIDWILEAGCHDGSDSVTLARAFKPIRYLAFEPDETARERALQRFRYTGTSTIELYPFGLSNHNSMKFLKYEAEGKGSGSTHLTDEGDDPIAVKVFDELIIVEEVSGLLWLDVEGHALQALQGMSTALSRIVIAKVEVQLHTRNSDFIRDFAEVIQIMKQFDLLPIFGPVYPGYFGDIVFLRKDFFKPYDKFRGKILIFQMKFLHSCFYPMINKPTRIL
jgi:FkbM family methyltransferase